MMLALGRGLPDLGWQATLAIHENEDFTDAAQRAGVPVVRSPSFHDDWGGARLLLADRGLDVVERVNAAAH